MARSCIEDYWMNKILRFRVLAAALSAFFGLMATVHASEAVFPMASRIGLVPPAGLAASHRFPGFEDKKTGASVLIFDLAKQAYSDAAKQLSKESLKKQGIIEETQHYRRQRLSSSSRSRTTRRRSIPTLPSARCWPQSRCATVSLLKNSSVCCR
jgi:hypothetical protein